MRARNQRSRNHQRFAIIVLMGTALGAVSNFSPSALPRRRTERHEMSADDYLRGTIMLVSDGADVL
jgi:hypothetical protein